MFKQLLLIASAIELALSAPLAQGQSSPPAPGQGVPKKSLEVLLDSPQLKAIYDGVIQTAKGAPITPEEYQKYAAANWGSSPPDLDWATHCNTQRLCEFVGAEITPAVWSYQISGGDQHCAVAYYPGTGVNAKPTEDECRVTLEAIIVRANRASQAVGPVQSTRWMNNVVESKPPTPAFPAEADILFEGVRQYPVDFTGAAEDPAVASWQIYA